MLPAWSLAGWDIDPLDEADGRVLVKEYTLSGDSRFELLKDPTPRRSSAVNATPRRCSPIVYRRWREAEGGEGGATWRSG